MKSDLNNLLPVGSICKIKKLDNELMVAGYFLADHKKQKISTYIGIPYPSGLVSPKLLLGFNNNDIEKVLFEGYKDIRFNGLVSGMVLALDDEAVKTAKMHAPKDLNGNFFDDKTGAQISIYKESEDEEDER